MTECTVCSSYRIAYFRLDSDWGGGSGHWSNANDLDDTEYTEQDLKDFENNDRPDIECYYCLNCNTTF